MSWWLLGAMALGLGLALLSAIARRSELRGMRATLDTAERARREGSAKAQLQHPVIDLTRCLGCGTCVSACPEDDVLEMIHGQARVVHGAHCVGTATCEAECPTGAIVVTLADLEERDDIPNVDDSLEAIGAPGLYLAGEVTAHALIRTAIEHGRRVAEAAAERAANAASAGGCDLLIVGAGPAGLACALRAGELGLTFVLIDQEAKAGGTVAQYPRAKLVLTQPVEMPGYGRFSKTSYVKEELIELWDQIVAESGLQLRAEERFTGLERLPAGGFRVHTEAADGPRTTEAGAVCLAIGRRGTPRRLGIPGEDLPKVAYSLLDAQSFTGRRILVVGGGDSAVEAALGLAEQPGNKVTLSYRGEAFHRIRSKNRTKLERARERGTIEVLTESHLVRVEPDAVHLELPGPTVPDVERRRIDNDDVFIFAGGMAPFDLLRDAGVSFDPALRPAVAPVGEQGSGLVRALAIGLALCVAALGFALFNADYYLLDALDRPSHPKHDWLRPGRSLGLWLGVGSVALILINLAYLARRSPRVRFELGSLRLWMTSHVATGILAVLFAMLHGAMAPGDTVGGHAFAALAFLLVTGGIGRYLYAYVPRAANGRELELREVQREFAANSAAWDQQHGPFAERAQAEIAALVERRQWSGSLPSRLGALVGSSHDLRACLARLDREAREQGLSDDQRTETLALARRAHGAALMAAHFEDLRGVLSSWRYLHRWAAALMVLLVVLHVVQALRYGASYLEGLT